MLHFASPASPKDYLEMPIQTLKVGSLGTHNTLGLAKAKGARYFLASTSEVYGDPQVHPQTESYWGHVNPIGPRGRVRRGQAVRRGDDDGVPPLPRPRRPHRADLQHLRRLGCGRDDGRVVSNFIVQALAGKPLTIYGDGSQTRSFCYVDDEVRGLCWPCSTPTTSDRSTSATRNEFTMRELADIVLEVTGSTSEIVVRAAPGRRPHAAPARHLPGPPHPRLGADRSELREGIARTAEYFRSLA